MGFFIDSHNNICAKATYDASERDTKRNENRAHERNTHE